MHLFYAPGLESGDRWTLDREESHHASRVLRLHPGDPVVLVNGMGGWFDAVIDEPGPTACEVRITRHVSGYGLPPYRLHIAMAPTKQTDRYEWFVEKATEIGISEITPVICDRSERRDIKAERLLRIAVAAMKQSVKAGHPIINPPVAFRKLAGSLSGRVGIAHCGEGSKIRLDGLFRPDESVTVLIGPEGDFTPSEIELALGLGFRAVTLGESRLRTETAGLVACQTIAWLAGN